MSTQVARWERAVVEARDEFVPIAAKTGMAYERESSFAMQALARSDVLQKCDPASIRMAVVNVASVGLTLSPALALAYLVPRKGKCCLDISYRGLIKLAVDSGLKGVYAESVRKNDEFLYENGFTPPTHRFDPFATAESRGEVVGVYCVALLASGVTQVDTLSMEEIAKIRAVSKAGDGPWRDWWEEMAKKSVIKRAAKYWPLSSQLAQAIEVLNEHEGADGINAPTDAGARTYDAESTREAVETLDQQKDAIRNRKVETVEDLEAWWKEITGWCRDNKDTDFYHEMKEKVRPVAAKIRGVS